MGGGKGMESSRGQILRHLIRGAPGVLCETGGGTCCRDFEGNVFFFCDCRLILVRKGTSVSEERARRWIGRTWFATIATLNASKRVCDGQSVSYH